MAMGIWLPGGGGADVDAVTAEAGDVLEGKVIVGPDGEPLTGTLALSGNAADSQVLSGQTYYNTDAKTKRTGSMSNQGAWTSRLGANGKITIPAGYHNGAGYVDQALPAKGAATYTPGRSNQTIGAGQYLTGAQTILGDANLLAANIKKGVSIFGIIGSWEGYSSSPLYLFNNGSWGGVQTTGITSFGYDQDGVADTLRSYISGSNIVFEASPKGNDNWSVYVYARLNQTVDLSNYNYIKCNLSSIANQTGATFYSLQLGISQSPTVNNTPGSSLISYSETKNTGVLIHNISSIKGFYYIYLSANISLNYHNPSSICRVYVNQLFLSAT